ncbi:MAG: PAS domain S-box protein, partial [Panacibacter sp.]
MKKVNRSIWYIAALLLLSAFLFFGLAIQNNRRILSTTQWVDHTYNVIRKIKEIQSSVSASEAALNRHILQQDLQSGIEIQQIHRKLSIQIKDLQELTKDNPAEQQNISNPSRFSGEKINFENSILRLPSSEQFNKANGGEKEQHANKFIIETLDAITQIENTLLQERVAKSESTRLEYFYTTLGSGFLGLCIMLWILYKINLENRKKITAQNEANNNELKYKKLVEDASVIMYTANLHGKFTYASNKCFNLTGYTNDEILGMHFTDLIYKDCKKEIADQYQLQFEKNIQETTHEFLITTKDNLEKWVEQVAAIVYENGYPAGFQCIVKDITDRKTAELALQKKEHEIQTVLNNTREGFFVIDTDYRIQIINKKAKEQIEMISGKHPSAGMNFLSVVTEGGKELAKENFDLVFRGELIDNEFRYETPGGPIWSRISHSPIKNEDGTIAGAAVITHDITQARLAEEQIIAANEKIGAMLASTQEGFFMFDKNNIITMINEAGKKQVKKFTGREYSIGDNILQHIVPERQEIFKNIIQKILGGDTKETEVQLMTDEGEIWVHNNYFPVYDKNNEIIGVCASSKDITSHKLAEKKLEKIRAEREEYQFRLQSILDNTPVSIFIKDLQGRYITVNKSFKSIVQLTDDKIIGKTDFDFATKQDAERYKKADDLVMQTLQDIETEETVHTENGEQHLLIVKFPLFDKKQTLYAIGAIAADITERAASQQKIIDAMKKAEKAEQLQEEFLANMSHEIRTPMNGIIGMTNLLKNTGLDEEQKEFVDTISQSSDNLLILLNDILDLSKIKAGKVSIESIPFSLRETLETVINPFRISAKEKGLELLMQHDLTVPDNLTGDPYRLTQILSNLLSNAVKFTHSGFIKLSVGQKLQKENEITLAFSVSDSGIGIPAENLDSIFENFQQANTDTTRKFGGTGLGLSITKKLIKLQQGTITVSSKENEGATFIVVLNYSVNKEASQAEKTREITLAVATAE